MTARLLTAALLIAAVTAAVAQTADAPAVAPGYSSPRVDFGIVVADLDRATKFYTEALGLTQTGILDAPAELVGAIGLTDGLPLHVAVMQLGSGPAATQVKLMEVKGSRPSKPDATFLHSAYGIRYLTFYVADLDAALKRAAEHGVKPLADGAVALPESIAPGMGIACVRDPDGNFVELVGPRGK